MPRIRTTIINTDDRKEQLRRAFRVRQDLIENLRVSLDPEYPLEGVHRDDQKRAYFEVAADQLDAIQTVIHNRGHDGYTEVSIPDHPNGWPCANCGNISGPKLPPVCPNCGFRDIAPCPICGAEVARDDYRKIAESLFECPDPKDEGPHRVRLAFNDPLLNNDGTYRQPLVIEGMEAVADLQCSGVWRSVKAFIYRDWWSLRSRYESDIRKLCDLVERGELNEPGVRPWRRLRTGPLPRARRPARRAARPSFHPEPRPGNASGRSLWRGDTTEPEAPPPAAPAG